VWAGLQSEGLTSGLTASEEKLYSGAKAIMYHDFLDASLTVAKISERLFVSPRYLRSVFAKVGETPSEVLREIRLRAARSAHAGAPKDAAATRSALSHHFGFPSRRALQEALRRENVRP